MVDNSTRDKILKVAHKLFADKGLAGVSIRELATESGVNVAAINYHFTNKENLYLETLMLSITNMQRDVESLYANHESSSVEELSLAVYDYFQKNPEDLKTGFKFVISSNHFHMVFEKKEQEICGPPGGEYFFKAIKQEIPTAKDLDIEWAVRVIFTQIIHKAIVTCNESLCKSMSSSGLTTDLIRSDLRRTIKIVLAEIK